MAILWLVVFFVAFVFKSEIAIRGEIRNEAVIHNKQTPPAQDFSGRKLFNFLLLLTQIFVSDLLTKLRFTMSEVQEAIADQALNSPLGFVLV